MKLKEGDFAPEFTLKSDQEQTIKLQDFKGKYLILFFYPKDSTPGCTIEAKDFSGLIEDFRGLNAEVMGISKDSVSSHQKFRDKHMLKTALLSDHDSKICNDYGVLAEKSMFGKKYLGIVRTSFLIDSNAKIVKIWNKVKPIGHAAEVLNYLRNLCNE